MILLPEHKLGFIHIHKNAGSSVRTFLRTLGEKAISNQWRDRKVKNHVTYRAIVDAFPELAEYEFFATSRNPWRRLLSAYTWWSSKPAGSGGITQIDVAWLKNFSGFLRALEETHDAAAADPILNAQLRRFAANGNLRLQPGCVFYPSQYASVVDRDDRPVVRHLPMESLTDVLPRMLSERLGRPIEWSGVWRNKNHAQDWQWREAFSVEDDVRVRRLFAQDIAYFGYADAGPLPQDAARLSSGGRP